MCRVVRSDDGTALLCTLTASAACGRLTQASNLVKQKIPLAVFLAVTGHVAIASQTACTFESDKSAQYYELEFIGYGEVKPTIVFSSTAFGSGKRITLPPANYSLTDFSPKAASVHLEFHNSGNDSLPPSFSLTGKSGLAQLKLGDAVVDGSLKCEQ
jgi:hypothetical protein